MTNWEEVDLIQAGKRLGVRKPMWMGDWFTSWSPRNDNCNAEGPWDQWVDLAIKILQDPLTRIVRPEAFRAAENIATFDFYSEANRNLTDEEIEADPRFRKD
jgi:hypothetical protein